MVTVNGQPKELAGRSLMELLVVEGFDPARVVVELDGQIVPRANYGEVLLAPGNTVEVLRFVGGG